MQEYIEIETRYLKRIISKLERQNEKLIVEKEELQKQLNLHAVSHQREQFIALLRWVGDGYNLDKNAEKIADAFIKGQSN